MVVVAAAVVVDVAGSESLRPGAVRLKRVGQKFRFFSCVGGQSKLPSECVLVARALVADRLKPTDGNPWAFFKRRYAG